MAPGTVGAAPCSVGLKVCSRMPLLDGPWNAETTTSEIRAPLGWMSSASPLPRYDFFGHAACACCGVLPLGGSEEHVSPVFRSNLMFLPKLIVSEAGLLCVPSGAVVSVRTPANSWFLTSSFFGSLVVLTLPSTDAWLSEAPSP